MMKLWRHFKVIRPRIEIFFACIFSALALTSAAHSSSFNDSDFCTALLTQARLGIVGKIQDFHPILKKRFGDDLNDPSRKYGLYAFESDILNLFELAPEYRDLPSLSIKWNLAETDALDLVAYYGLRIFYNDLRIAGSENHLSARIDELSLQHFGSSRSYFQEAITQKSVPEMARELDVSEGQVYRIINTLGLSISAQFEPHLKQVDTLLKTGKSLESIAMELGLGRQALAFFLHFDHTAPRGVSWERFAQFEGHVLHENEILGILFSRELGAQEIADQLNEIFGTTDPAHPGIRTQKSVELHLKYLGLTPTKSVASNDQSQRILKRYEKQRKVIEMLLSWIGRNKRWPMGKDYRAGASDQILIKQDSVMGTGDYAPGKRVGNLAIFPNPEAFWLTLYQEQQKSNLGLRLLDVPIRGKVSETWRAQERIEAMRHISDWMRRTRRLPHSTDFHKSNVDGVDVYYTQATSSGDYALNKRFQGRGIFENAAELWVNIIAEAKKIGIIFSMFEVPPLDSSSEFLRVLYQEEALKELVDSYRKIGSLTSITRLFRESRFGTTSWAKFVGSGDYSVTGRLHSHRVFDSIEHAKELLQAALIKEGIEIR